MRANWTLGETETLKRLYSIRTANELAEIFPNYSNTQILRKAKQLKLKKKKEVTYKSRLENSIIQRNDLWTDKEKSIVIENYSILGAKGVMELMGENRSEEQIKKMAYRMNLQREDKSMMWEQTDIKLVNNNIFSVEATYKGR